MVFCFCDDLIFFSFSHGGNYFQSPGFQKTTVKHDTKQWLSNKCLPWTQGGCTLPDIQWGNQLHMVTTWKAPAFSNCGHSWGIAARAYLRVWMGTGNCVPSANSSSRELIRHTQHHANQAPAALKHRSKHACTLLHRHVLQGSGTRR